MMRDDFSAETLDETQRTIAAAIVAVVRTSNPDATGGGCRAFYSPAEWEARGEDYGKGSALIVVHDGGDLAAFFNLDYECYSLHDVMQAALEGRGYYAEQCTSWYSAIYPR